MGQHSWDTLPGAVRAQLEQACGPVARAERPEAGRQSELLASLTLADGQRVFCKGARHGSPAGRMLRLEQKLYPHLPAGVTGRLLWQVDTDGWLLLGLEHVPGHHANLEPGSPDLPLVADLMATLELKLTPSPLEDVPTLAEKWQFLAGWRKLRDNPPDDLEPALASRLPQLVDLETAALEHAQGDSLTHGDLHGLNILVADQARAVDWAFARRANPAADVAHLVIRLICDGHTPEQAESWAEQLPAWLEASDEARTSFAVAIAGIWEHLRHAHPLPAREAPTSAARAWAARRLGLG